MDIRPILNSRYRRDIPENNSTLDGFTSKWEATKRPYPTKQRRAAVGCDAEQQLFLISGVCSHLYLINHSRISEEGDSDPVMFDL
jgi:hypothetical protein